MEKAARGKLQFHFEVVSFRVRWRGNRPNRRRDRFTATRFQHAEIILPEPRFAQRMVALTHPQYISFAQELTWLIKVVLVVFSAEILLKNYIFRDLANFENPIFRFWTNNFRKSLRKSYLSPPNRMFVFLRGCSSVQ